MEATFSSSSSAALSAIASAFRTPEDLLLYPPYDLAEALDLSLKEAEEARAALAARFLFGSAEGAEDLGLLPPTLLSLSASYPPRHIPTGLPALDAALGGGIRMGIVTEIVGPAGAGKTQLCLCLAAAALGASAAAAAAAASCSSPAPAPAPPSSSSAPSSSELAGGVVWFDVEGAFSASRLVELAQRKEEEEEERRRERER